MGATSEGVGGFEVDDCLGGVGGGDAGEGVEGGGLEGGVGFLELGGEGFCGGGVLTAAEGVDGDGEVLRRQLVEEFDKRGGGGGVLSGGQITTPANPCPLARTSPSRRDMTYGG